jgi:hypothetical protein
MLILGLHLIKELDRPVKWDRRAGIFQFRAVDADLGRCVRYS